MAEMLGMTSAGLDRRNRLPLFPGTSCLPLSRGTSIGTLVCRIARHISIFTHSCVCGIVVLLAEASASTRRQIKKDQLNVIFDVIGTPKREEIDRARTSEARDYLRSLEPRDAIDLRERYRAADEATIDLLRRMLMFFPEDRITAEATLAHPFFTPIRRPDTEVCVVCFVCCCVFL